MKNYVLTIACITLGSFVSGCGGAGLGPSVEQPNHDIRFLNQVEQNIGDFPTLAPSELQTSGNAAFNGGIEVKGIFGEASAVGELFANVNFDDGRISMTSANFAAYRLDNGRFVQNVEGGLSMTDGTFADVELGGEDAAGYVGTINGAIRGVTVRANMIGTFQGETMVSNFAGRSRGDSTHEVTVYAER